MLCGQRVANGAELYRDVWYAGAPMMVWLYASFFAVFGSAAMWMMHLFACLYLYICAVYFNYFLLEFRPFQRLRWLPAVLLIVLESAPMQLQTIHSGLVMLLPLLYTVHILTRMGEEGVTKIETCFKAGLSIAFCLLTDYVAIGLLFGFLVLYIRLTSPRLDVFSAILGGTLVGVLCVVVYCYFQESLPMYWDQSVLYYIDEKRLTGSFLYPVHPLQTFLAILQVWGIVLLTAIAGFIHFRLRFFTYLRSIRNVEVAMSTWAIAGLISLAISYRRVELYDFLVILPPLIFYTVKVWEFASVSRYWGVALVLTLLLPVFNMYAYQPPIPAIEHRSLMYFMRKMPSGEAWLLDDALGLYRYTNPPTTLKYLDFRMAYHKLSCFGAENRKLYSHSEPDILFFKEFNTHRPRYIIDAQGRFFPTLLNRYPTLFSVYQRTIVGKYSVYIAP